MVEKVDKGKYSYKKVRKYVGQMKPEEKQKVRYLFKSVKSWEIVDHVNDRIIEKGYRITTDDILDVMRNGKIVEYEQKLYTNTNKFTELIVLNNVRKKENGSSDILHLVFDVTDKKIVTVWINNHDDLHDTLDMKIYNKGLKVGVNYWEN